MDNETLESIIAATPGKLILMLYARAVRDLKSAAELYDLKGDPRAIVDAVHLIVHAQQIIAELCHSVNEEHPNKEMTINLKKLYEYMQYRLTEGIAKQNNECVKEVLSLMEELHNAWETMINRVEKGEKNAVDLQ